MMSEFLRVNSGDLLPLNTVRRIREVTARDRESLSNLNEKLDVDTYQTRIELADGKCKYAIENISDYSEQGVELVKVDEGAYIPGDNIISARDLSEDDRREISDKIGRELRAEFISSVETTAGRILATIDAAKVMHRMAHPSLPS